MLSVFNYKIFIQNIFTISLIIANKMKNKAKFNNLETVPKSNTKINCKNKAPSSKSVCLAIFRDATSAMRGALPIPDVWSSHVGCLTYNGKHFRFIEDKNKFNNISSYIGTRTESDCQ
jgi:hypothetical protein